MKNAGILFDYNGVLVNDEHLQEEAMAHVLAHYGCNLTPELYEETCLGRPDREAFARVQEHFLQMREISIEELVDQKIQKYQELIQEKSILYHGAPEILQSLGKDFLLAIVTGSLRVEVEPVLAKENIAPLFQAVITADDIKKGKPNPEGYLKGIHALHLSRDKIVVVEDTPAGVQAAKTAGLRCIAVLHTVGREKLKNADKVVEGIHQITASLIHEVVSHPN